MYEGHAAREDRGETEGPGELVWPLAVYDRGEGCAAVIGGYAYRGGELPAVRGREMLGAVWRGTRWSGDPSRPNEVRRELELEATIASFGEDLEGELYIVSRTGSIFRLSD